MCMANTCSLPLYPNTLHANLILAIPLVLASAATRGNTKPRTLERPLLGPGPATRVSGNSSATYCGGPDGKGETAVGERCTTKHLKAREMPSYGLLLPSRTGDIRPVGRPEWDPDWAPCRLGYYLAPDWSSTSVLCNRIPSP